MGVRQFADFAETLTGGEGKEDIRQAIIDEIGRARAMAEEGAEEVTAEGETEGEAKPEESKEEGGNK